MHSLRSKHPTSPQHPSDLEDDRDRRPPPGLALDPPAEPPPDHPPEIPVDHLDSDALRVIARLRHMRHQAYFVGGCVRDLLLDHTPKDFDVATDAHPGEVRAIFRNCRLIGRRFRLAHVYFRGGKVIEVATFRKNPIDVADDVPDGSDLLITRDNVFGTAEEDAVRRDFTVNGLFYDVSRGEVIDYVGGRADLEDRRIATIGDPEIRIREDPVRSLRAVRFAARLGFTIAPDTFEAMRRHASELARCAPARVLEEMFKILRCGGSARAFELLRACGALPVVLSSLAAALDAWDDGRRRAFFAHLTALDRLVRSGEEVSEAVLLGALLGHLGGPRPADAPETTSAPGGNDADALLASLVQTSRLPRKIAERTRLALQAQRTFREPPRRKRRRGRGPGGQPHFTDALQLLRISVEATGEGRELLERWTRPEAHGAAAGEQAHGGDRGHGAGRDHGPERRAAPVYAAASPGEGEPPRARDFELAEADEAAGEEEGDGPEIVEVDISGSGPGSHPREAGSHAAAEGAPGGRRRRRRRGGRRRRRRGGAPDAGAPPAQGG